MSDRERPPSWNPQNAAAFELEDVVAQYHLRHPYPSTLAPFLLELATPSGGPVLELGCGTGEIARALAPHLERIDAIDISPRMIERARTMPGGGHQAIRWTICRAEDAPLEGPYALAVAGASLHWMDWDIVLPRIAKHLAPGAVLAIVVSREVPAPWADALREIISRYSVIQNWQNADLIALLESRGVFKPIAKEHLAPEPHYRTVDEYVDGQHATSGLARERMGAERARAFDAEVRALVTPYANNGVLALAAGAEVDRGRPLP
jgi:trans-aconitate methyltransferase